MKIASVKASDPEREEVRNFFGLNRRPARRTGESVDEINVSADVYPFLTPRRDKVRLTNNFGTCRTLMMKDQPVWITENAGGTAASLFYAGNDTGVVLAPGEKRTVTMGTRIIVFPDAVYYDTATGAHGSLDAVFTSVSGVAVRCTLCRLDGAGYEYSTSTSAPQDPADGALWCDISGQTPRLMMYSASSGVWTSVDSTYIKIECPGIGAGFSRGDGVTLSGFVSPGPGGAYVIEDCGDDFIVVPGIISSVTSQETPVTVSRLSPLVDFVVECGNRLWACRNGLDRSGNFVNEIYATKLGDPFNWNAYSGLVSDSYAASVGTDGPFTGCAVFLGNPTFFKERSVHKVFGNRPSNYQIVTGAIAGVAAGAWKSVTQCRDMLYYVSREGFMAYDGTIPYSVSEQLGDISPTGAVAESKSNKVYLYAVCAGVAGLYVYHTDLSIWHRYSDSNITDMACAPSGILTASDGSLFVVDSNDFASGASALTGYDTREAVSEPWFFETGELTAERADMYVEKLEVTASVPAGGELRLTLISGEEEKTVTMAMRPTVRRTLTVPVVTGKSRRYRIRINGVGACVVYSISKFVERI